MDGKPGTIPKNSAILNSIVKNRVPKRHNRVMKMAIKKKEKEKHPMSEKQRIAAEKMVKANAELYAAERANPELKVKRLEENARKKEEAARRKEESGKIREADPVENGEEEVLTAKERKLRDLLMRVVEGFGGESKILDMAKKSDSLKIVLLKELLKIETREMEARLRAKVPQGQGNAGFVFIINGLENAKKIKESGMDMKFLGNALHPDEPIDIGRNDEEEEDVNNE